jgi:Mce-associated membrane protein
VARTTAEKPATDAAEPEAVEEAEPVKEQVPDVEEQAGEAEAEAAEPGESEAAQSAAAGDPRRRWPPRDPVLLVAVVLVVAAAACVGCFGWSWYRAAHDDSLAYSRDRDAVLRAGEQGVQNMNTLDYRKVDQGLSAWEDSSTGDLHQELVQGRAQFTAQVRQGKTVTTAKVLDGAVTELDDRAGKASVIVAVQITVTPPAGTPATKQSRMRAQLTRTPSGWKLSALGQAPVGTTAGGG